ncbi:MAG: efflux RND transporter periplasmic adaptor subunit [Bacillota bacterium]|nr:efflux RND transporter periplasmic adaptor subunit [Bacillota bacterium]
MTRAKFLWLVLILVALDVAMVSWNLVREVQKREAVVPVAVSTIRARSGPWEVVIPASGVAKLVQKVGVPCPVGGRVKEVYVQPGEVVEKGQLIAVLDEEELRDRLAALEREWRRAWAEWMALRKDQERLEYLYQSKMASKAVVEEAESKAALAREEFNRRWEAYRELVRLLTGQEPQVGQEVAVDPEVWRSAVEVRAPLRGLLLPPGVSPGEEVGAGQEAFSLGVLSPLVVQTRVATALEEEEERPRVGQPAIVTFQVGQEKVSLPAAVAAVKNQGQKGPVAQWEVELVVENPDLQLRPGMVVSAGITVYRAHEVIALPLQALHTTTGAGGIKREVVFVVERGRARAVEVQTGFRRGQEVEIRSGLREGEEVIVEYREVPRLVDGTPIYTISRQDG